MPKKSKSDEQTWEAKILDPEKGPPDDSWQWSIDRVPKTLRQIVTKNPLDPRIVSIGPLHYDKRTKDLQAMENHKRRFLLRLLRENSEGNSVCGETAPVGGREESFSSQNDEHPPSGISAILDDLANAMRKQEKKARTCYSETFKDIDSETFVEMMVVDGCFIVELLHLHFKYDQQQKDPEKAQGLKSEVDPLFNASWMLGTLRHDLLMLENQLPFFVLKELYNLTEKADGLAASVPLETLAINFFNPFVSPSDPDSKSKSSTGAKEESAFTKNRKGEYAHLLDVIHSALTDKEYGKDSPKPPKKKEYGKEPKGEEDPNDGQIIVSASELEELGVKLRKRGKTSNSLNFSFQEGTSPICSCLLKSCYPILCRFIFQFIFLKPTLEIPPLQITQDKIPLFLNFVAYEQCHNAIKPLYSSYFIFLEGLVQSSKDVQLLEKYEILEHDLTSDREVVTMLHKLRREIACDRDRDYFLAEVNKIKDYCKQYNRNTPVTWYRDMVRKYFSSPWSCMSVFAAGVALALTIAGTVYSVLSYYHSNK